MGLLDKLSAFLQKSNVNWEQIKNSGSLYPKSSVAILSVKTNTGKLSTGWVNKAYEKYPYKEFCPYNLSITVDLIKGMNEGLPGLDMYTIEEFFVEALRAVCVAHIVARITGEGELYIEAYVEKADIAVQRLQEISNAPEQSIYFHFQVNKDPKWQTIDELMRL